ncbi:hypothetical protein ACFL7M_17505 [Thermodesulfobacteriota bacterium]
MYVPEQRQTLRVALNEPYDLGYDHHLIFNREIEEVTPKDIQRAVKRIIRLRGYVMVIVGPKP